MYQVGDRVVYGVHGVCQVVDLEERVIDRKRVTYLALEPVAKDGSRFLLPTHNENAMSKLRPMYSGEEWEQLLQSDGIHNGVWIPEDGKRKLLYRELLSGGDRIALITMICTVYRHRQIQFNAGKKVHQCDDNFLRDAERIVAGELAVVLDMEFGAALQYLRNILKKDTL